MPRLARTAGALLLLQGAACFGAQRYHPAPLPPPYDAATRFAERRLSDSALARLLERYGAPRDSVWDPDQLALVALFFRPDLVQARRAVDVARASEITAGARPAPTATATVEQAARPDEGRSTAWTFALASDLTLETAGKRTARIARARALALAAQLGLEAAGWDVAQDARAAAVAAEAADVDLADARAEAGGLAELRDLLQVRFTEGQITRTELSRVASELQAAAVAAGQADRVRTGSRLTLARALAVPLDRVERLPLRPGGATGCYLADSLSLDTLEVRALTTRATIGAALAGYAAAEADLREQVARQYPDLSIGPGITWEQGIRRWVLSLALPAIAVNRARGPIAEARARRAEQAARVSVLQDSILAAVDSSVAACRGAREQTAVADSLQSAIEAERRLVEAAFDRGEVGRADVVLARVAQVRAQRAGHEAAARVRAAGVALERASGAWRGGELMSWPAPLTSFDSASDPPATGRP